MLAFWKNSYDKPRQCIKKQRHHFVDKSLSTIVKAMVFLVVMYGCESWATKKAEHWRTDAFELWCWRRLLRVPWTARRSHQSILKEINPEYSLEGLMLKLKLNICCCSSVAQSCPTLCDPMNCSTLGFPVLSCLQEFAQTYVHWIDDAIQSSHSLPPFSSCSQSFPAPRSFLHIVGT